MSSDFERFAGRRAAVLLLVLVGIVWTVISWRNVWVCDDAYITFRSVEQLMAGNGPRWNSHERVQAFTHPLWFLVLSLARVVSAEPWWNAVVLSFLFSTGALLVLARRLAWGPVSAALLVLGAVSSKAFVDYSSSGLEGSLVFLLLALFVVTLGRSGETETTPEVPTPEVPTPKVLGRLVFLGSLLLLCRHDLLLVVGPPIAVVAWQLRGLGSRRLVSTFMVWSSPFLAWTLFAIVYYGFPFPNTAYAKLNTGVSAAQLWRQGAWYWWNALRWDPATVAICAAGAAFLLRQRRPALSALGGGLVLYGLYVVRIGGDFMAGRFLTPIFFVALAVLSLDSPGWRKRSMIGCMVSLGVLALIMPGSRLLLDTSQPADSYLARDEGENGIADEKQVYIGRGSFLSFERKLQAWTWEAGGDSAREGRMPVVQTTVGWAGFHAGLDTIMVDVYALTDPLLARLPSLSTWRIGHFSRQIPAGYLESLHEGENRLRNPSTRALYEQVRRVTEGPLFTVERFKAIVWLNFVYQRSSCFAPPCRSFTTQVVPMEARRPVLELGAAGAIEKVTLSPYRSSEDVAEITLSGWISGDHTDLVLLTSQAPRSAKIVNVWRQDLVERSQGKIGPLAGFRLVLGFASHEEAAFARGDLCLAMRDHDAPDGTWYLVPSGDAHCAPLLLH